MDLSLSKIIQVVQYSKTEEEKPMKRISAIGEADSVWRDRLYRAANLVVKIFGCCIFAGLIWYAMRYTEFIMPGEAEKPLITRDSELKNAAALLVSVLLLALLYQVQKRTNQTVQRRISMAAVAAAMLWIGFLSFWWICSADRMPVGDQAFVYGAASYFREGNYYFFGEGGYLEMYPYQLGLVALIELLFVFVGPYNYFAFEVISALMAVGIVYFGYHIVKLITDNRMAEIFYCLSIMCCVPLVLYTSWVYGDIPSIFFSLLAFDCLLRYEASSRKRWLAGMALATTLAVLVRQNSLLFVVALVLAGIVHLLKKKDIKLCACILLCALLPQMVFGGISQMYEIRSGEKVLDGIPKATWVAMGLQKNWRGNGWYNNYCKEVYYGTGCDPELTEQIAKQEIRSQLTYMRDNPSYTVDFFKEKILSQWNQPLYQSVYFNTEYSEKNPPAENSIADSLTKWNFSRVLAFSDRIQFMVFVGMLCYFVLCVKKDSNILHHIMAITMIGGFLFSIIWEAKARYILPYFVMMFPFAAAGYWQIVARISQVKEREEEEDNVIPFKKSA